MRIVDEAVLWLVGAAAVFMALRIFRLPASQKGRLNLFGAAVLVAGLFIATWIWIAQDRLDRRLAETSDDGTEQTSLLDSRKGVRQLEVYEGKSGVVFEEWDEWLGSLLHGKRLAGTIAIASCVIGVGCFMAAEYLTPTGQSR